MTTLKRKKAPYALFFTFQSGGMLLLRTGFVNYFRQQCFCGEFDNESPKEQRIGGRLLIIVRPLFTIRIVLT